MKNIAENTRKYAESALKHEGLERPMLDTMIELTTALIGSSLLVWAVLEVTVL